MIKKTIWCGLDFFAELYLIFIMWKNIHWSIALLVTITRFENLTNHWIKELSKRRATR